MPFEDSEEQKRQIDELAKSVRIRFEGWKRIQANLDSHISRRSTKQIAIAQLCRRQLTFLEGATAAAVVGRPEVVTTSMRCLYEAWLYMLAIAYLPNPSGKRAVSARRYLSFGKFQL